MNPIFDEINLEKYIHTMFGLRLDVKSMIANKVPVGPGAFAKVFLSNKGLLYALIISNNNLMFGDIKKIVSKMNLRVEQFMPPRADSYYFDRLAESKFREVFPGRGAVKDSDLVFYRTLAPYNPALVQVSEVVDGVIKQYDRDAVGDWRPNIKFAYRRIRTS